MNVKSQETRLGSIKLWVLQWSTPFIYRYAYVDWVLKYLQVLRVVQFVALNSVLRSDYVDWVLKCMQVLRVAQFVALNYVLRSDYVDWVLKW